jgi:hypothetical protein
MALRKVNGASEHSLLALLCMDFLFTILLASILGMGFIELLKSWFIHYSGIADTDMSIYGYCILYIAGMSILAYIIALLSVYIFRRRSLQHAPSHKRHRTSFSKGERCFTTDCLHRFHILYNYYANAALSFT